MVGPHGEPVFTKNPDTRTDHRPLTGARFQVIRAWARWAAKRQGFRVYLVGSALEKARPRDVDLALVYSDEEFARRFGATNWETLCHTNQCHPTDGAYEAERLAAVFSTQGIVKRLRIDPHLAPASWFPERPRLLLGDPGDQLPAPDRWRGELFVWYRRWEDGERRGFEPCPGNADC